MVDWPECLENALITCSASVRVNGGFFGGYCPTLQGIEDFQDADTSLVFSDIFGLDLSSIPSYCPSAFLGYGRVLGKADVIDQITVLQCMPYLEEVDVSTRFSLPSYAIDMSQPPDIIESSARVLKRLGVPTATTWYSLLQFANMSAETSVLDPLFQAAIFGTHGIPAEELLGTGGTQNLIDSVSHVFAVSAAQLMNANNRMDAPLNTTLINGTVITQNRVRLVQNETSTRLLQALLAIMILCALVVFSLMGTRRVVSKNPCSIAAVASLLTGSRLLSDDIIPKGSEWGSDKELKQRGVFEGGRFTLGWWDQEGSEVKRFGIDVDEASYESGTKG